MRNDIFGSGCEIDNKPSQTRLPETHGSFSYSNGFEGCYENLLIVIAGKTNRTWCGKCIGNTNYSLGGK